MNISACVITKDEEKNIDRCLESIKNIVDEIIIVDTGSNDNTVNVAKRYSNKIFHYVWEDDFSKARNFAIEKANGDYILFLDADEYLDCYFELKEFLKNEELFKDAYLIKIKNIDKDEKNKLIDEFLAIRLFKNDINIRYQGTIHEQVININGNNLSISYIDKLNIYHTGYSSSLMKKKAERNLERLEQEYAKNANNDRLYSYLCETHYYLGNKNKAEEYARLDIALGRRNVSYASRSYRILIEILKENDSRILELKDILEKSIKSFPKLPEFMAEFALYYASVFDYDMAIKNMNTAISLAEKYNDIEPTIFKNDKIEIAKKLILDWLEIKNDKIKISACVIVKNEEKNIGKWLESSSVYADELIVVDTGSDDKTIDIVKNTDAKLFYYRWNNNFADAKNYAISKASGDWIVFLDADEYFALDTISNVRKIITRENNNIDDVDAIMCTIINIDQDQNDIELHRFVNLRIFRRVNYLKFYSNIHEGIRNSKGQLKFIIEKDKLKIIHTGYSKSIIKSKLKRNLELLLDDIEKNGEGIQHYRYLADCYSGMEDYEKAIKYALLHINSNATSVGNESDVYRTLINSMVFMKKKPLEIEPYIIKAINIFPNMPDFHAYYAGNLFRQNKFVEAKPYLQKALELYFNNSSYNDASCFANLLSETYSYLAEIAIIEGDLAEAKILFQKSLDDNKYNVRALQQFSNLIMSTSENKIVIEILSNYYKENDYYFLLGVLKNCKKINEVFAFFADKIKINDPEILAYNNLIKGYYGKNQKMLLDLLTKSILYLVNSIFIKKIEKTEEYEKYIPDNIYVILNSFSKNIKVSECEFEAYMIILKEIIRNPQDEILNKYLDLASNFSIILKFQIAVELAKKELWRESNKLLTDIMNDTDEQNVEFFYWIGLCRFYMGDFGSSKNFFCKAHELKDKYLDIESYLLWIDEEHGK